MKYYFLLALCALFAGCGGGGGSSQVPEVPIPTPEELAAQDYTWIGENANRVLSTDRLAWVPGATEPDRVSTDCKDHICAAAFSAWIIANRTFSTDVEDIVLLPDTNGIRTVVEQASGKYSDLYTYGGWMQHSYFFSLARLYTHEEDPDEGVRRVTAYANGYSTGTNPEVQATWTGFVTASDRSVATNLESVVTGDASISVTIDTQVLVDVNLTDMANRTTGQVYADVSYDDMLVTDGQFSRYHADNDRLSGTFFGPDHEEVGGVFEHPQGLLGAYGGDRD